MKKRALFLMAACAVMFAAAPVSAAEITCADWQGDWVFTYAGGVTDDVTFTELCDNTNGNNKTCLPVDKQGQPATYFTCVAHGTRASNGQVIQIRKIQFDTSSFAYYEATDAEILATGQATPNATIPNSAYNSDCQKFTVSKATAPIDLVSGQKKDAPACAECQLNIIPANVNALSLVAPLGVFIIIGPSTNDFPFGASATFADRGIHSLLQLRITAQLIIAFVWVDWYGTTPGSSDVSVGTCTGSITIN
jgi:hypothetical protein